MTRKTFAMAAAAAALVALAAWVALHRQGAAGADAAAPPGVAASAAPVPVVTFRAQQRDVPVTVDAAGSVVPIVTVDIRPQVASTVRGIAIKEGQFVKRGDVLFTLDDRADRANLEKAREQLLRDQAALADAQRQWQRARDLLAQNFVAQSAVDSARTAVDAAAATVRADDAAVQAAGTALTYDTLRAPISGRAGTLAVNLGSLVLPTGTALVTLSQIDPIAVSFNVPEAQVGALLQGLKTGSPVRVLPPSGPGAQAAAATASAASAPSAAESVSAPQGRLTFVDNAIDPGTGTIRAKAELPNAGPRLWPGQYVTVRLQLGTLPGAVVIPQAAVIQRGNDRGVYVVGADELAQWRPVQVRLPLAELAVIDGVKAGERVVVDGKQNVRPGAPVRESRASAPRPAGRASGAAGASGAAA